MKTDPVRFIIRGRLYGSSGERDLVVNPVLARMFSEVNPQDQIVDVMYVPAAEFE